MTAAAALLALIAGQAQAPADLSADSRLQADIELTAPARPLEVICAELSQLTGVNVTVAADVKETLAVVRWKDASSGHLMERIAKFFQWEWQKEHGGYRLVRSPEAQRREEEELRRELIQPYVALKQDVRRAIAEAARPPTEDEKRRIEELRKAIRAQFPRGIEEHQAYSNLFQELERLERRTDLGDLVARIAYDELDDDALHQLALGKRVVLATNPTRAQRRLGARAQEAVRDWLNERARLSQDFVDAAERLPPIGTRPRRVFEVSDVATVVVSIQPPPFVPPSVYPPEVEVSVVDRELRQIDAHTCEVAPRPNTEDRYPQDQAAAERALPGAADPITVQRRLLEAPYPRTEPLEPYGQALIHLANRAGANLIAECSDLQTSRPRHATVSGSTVGAVLESLASAYLSTWSYERGTIEVRFRYAPRYMRAVTSSRLLLPPIIQTAAERWGYTLDQAASVASRLTDLQARGWDFAVRSGSGQLMIEPWLSDDLVRATLRAWAAIPEVTRRQLLSGGDLPLRALPPTALRHLQDLVRENGLSFGPSRIFALGERLPSLPRLQALIEEERASWELSLHTDPTTLFPDGLPPDTAVSALRFSSPAVGYTTVDAGVPVRMLMSAGSLGFRYDWSRLRPATEDGLIPAEIQTLLVVLHPRPGLVCIGYVWTGQLVSGAKPVSISELPEETRQAIEWGRRARGGGG